MPRTDGWRRRLLPALLGAVLLLAPLLVGGHVHADEAARSTSCLVCTVAGHAVSDVPVVARVGSQPWRLLPAAPPAPTRGATRPLAASPSRGPPAPGAPSPH